MGILNWLISHRRQGKPKSRVANVSSVPDTPVEQNAKALVRRGIAYGKQGKSELAIADFRAALTMPDVTADLRAWALVSRGVAYSEQGKTELEMADYSAVISMHDVPEEPRSIAEKSLSEMPNNPKQP